MVTIRAHAEGCLLSVRVQPGARRAGVQGVHGEALKVAVSAPAQEGRANAAVVDLLREALGLKRSQVELAAGATSRDKLILVRGLSKEELEAKIATLLG
jgi:uncharacterized protein (TIGR00251 family)